MYQNNLDQKNWNVIISLYCLSKGLAHKASDKVLLGVMTLYIILNNPSWTYAKSINEKFQDIINDPNPKGPYITICICISVTLIGLGLALNNKMARIVFAMAGIGCFAAGLDNTFLP